jgi:aspartate/methionine/tyrosine aminotransferase
MKIVDFALERYFAQYEFTTPYILCSSDVQGMPMHELLALADADALTRWQSLTLGYTETSGLPALREAIADLYVGVTPDDVITFAGAEEAVFIAANVLLGPGDHLITTWPGYQSLYEVGRATGADVTLIELTPESGWQLTAAQVRQALRPNTKMVLINTPHNPTGSLMAQADWHEVVALCAEAGVVLFADEVYRFLEYNPQDRLPAACELSTSALSLGVMSKAFGLAGLRIGWLVVRDADVRARLLAYKDYTTICNSAPSEILALIALRAAPQVLARSRRIIQANVAAFTAACARHAPVLSMVPPQAGSVAFAQLNLAKPIAEVAHELAHQHGVLILPATVYGYPGNYFRVGFGKADFEQGLARFEAYLGAQTSER